MQRPDRPIEYPSRDAVLDIGRLVRALFRANGLIGPEDIEKAVGEQSRSILARFMESARFAMLNPCNIWIRGLDHAAAFLGFDAREEDEQYMMLLASVLTPIQATARAAATRGMRVTLSFL